MSAALSASRPSLATIEARCAETLALTLWGEAGGRSVRAIEGLAALLGNRAVLAITDPAARIRFAPAVRGRVPRALLLAAVCRAPFQFACWHPQRAPLAAPAGDAALAICRRVAARAIAGALADPTAGATHCHDIGDLPRWALGEMPCADIGGLVFYRLPG